MSKISSRTPSYRKRSGYDQAIVTLTDRATKRRRDYWLGEYNTPESRERYHRLVAAWEANDRRHPEPEDAGIVPARRVDSALDDDRPTVAMVIAADRHRVTQRQRRRDERVGLSTNRAQEPVPRRRTRHCADLPSKYIHSARIFA